MIEELTRALKSDPDYYYGWQSNIAMAFYDEYRKARKEKRYNMHEIANKSAQNFLNKLISQSEKDEDSTKGKSKIDQLREDKNLAYWERNQLVRFLSTQYPSYLMRHPDSDEKWENDWRWIVCINTVVGQMTWHIHDSELDNFKHLEIKENDWDGHSTEEKYQRLLLLSEKEYYCETDGGVSCG